MLAESGPNLIPIVVLAVLVAGFAGYFIVRGRSRGGTAPTDITDAEIARASVPETVIDSIPEVAAPTETIVEPAPAMGRVRSVFAGAISKITGAGKISEETWEELEEALLRADVGVKISDELLNVLRAEAKSGALQSPEAAIDRLRGLMLERIVGSERELNMLPDEANSPNVWMFVGVNGVGKTTSIGKVAAQRIALGNKVLLAAGDTFRAAAAEQLATWADRAGAEFVRGAEGADPSSVIFDAVESAAAKNVELVLADTAGRLHTKSNLMEELAKVRRVAAKGRGRVSEVLLVIDATTGQNGLVQAREFALATAVTGVILTKLDGSAKGGIVFAIETELGIPVKLVGLGEKIGDLIAFDPEQYIAALFAN